MTKITGIIAEFNPFHKGHQHLLNQAEGLKIVAMSGNWVQRGAPAIFDKWTRAQMALQNGADLVVELPTMVSVQAADFFAQGAVDILVDLGIDELIFGSESSHDYNQITSLYAEKSAEMLDFIYKLPDNFSYPEKTQLMWQKFSQVKFDGNTPNHVLALAYAKAAVDKQIQLRAIARVGDFHSPDLSGKFASATAIRQFLSENSLENADSIKQIKSFIPENTVPLYQNVPVTWENYFSLLRYKIIVSQDLNDIFQMNDELANRLKKAIFQANSVTELIDLVHTKRYTKARVSRLLTYILLEIRSNYQLPDKIHVLGFSETGQKHLRQVSEKTLVRIGQNPWDSVTQRADAIYRLGSPEIFEQNFGRIPLQIKS